MEFDSVIFRTPQNGNRTFDVRLMLGDGNGNHFVIAIRNVVGDQSEIMKGVQSLQEKGFINYFGMQRFGTR